MTKINWRQMQKDTHEAFKQEAQMSGWEWECMKCGGKGYTTREWPECPLCGPKWYGRYRQKLRDQAGNADLYGQWRSTDGD